MKIINLINESINRKISFFSFEFYPPHTETGLDNLLLRIDRMSKLVPLFIDVTSWADSIEKEKSLELCIRIQKVLLLFISKKIV